MDESGDGKKVVDLGVRFKPPDQGESLLLIGHGTCFHGPYIVDHEKAEVTCKKCGEKLNPIQVLHRLAAKESQYRATSARYQDEMKRLGERKRTKCQYCKRMTRIER